MEVAAWVGLAAGLAALLAIPVGWVWKLSEWNAGIKKIPDMNTQMQANARKIERLETIIEPFWDTVCKNLPSILNYRNSPDRLEKALNGGSTREEMQALKDEMMAEFDQVRQSQPDRAVALLFGVWTLKVMLGGFGCPGDRRDGDTL